MEADWKDHKIKVTGNWTGRWLYLAPDYELWVDDQKVDRAGGPRPHAADRNQGIVVCHPADGRVRR